MLNCLCFKVPIAFFFLGYFTQILTCYTSRKRRERGDDELVGEVEHVVVCVAWNTQRGEADHHRVGTSTGAAQSAHLSGIWNAVDKIMLNSFRCIINRLLIISTTRHVFYLLVVCSTWHLAFPTKMEAFSLLKPVPLTTKSVPRPLDPAKNQVI